ncbi:MAG: response regulator [Candidatus Omnitrophica bacterium]|nr:response regulator [Candidatus Omnitrophota bacterium]
MENNQQLKLLIVDDESAIVHFTKKIFDKKGFISFGATDGASAVEVFKKERPHICLIDIHMPFSPFDGVETLKQIKKIDQNAVCLMVSRITEKDRVTDCRNFGALAYLLKPLDFDDLDRAVEKARAYVKTS